jgi:hypothetical protein
MYIFGIFMGPLRPIRTMQWGLKMAGRPCPIDDTYDERRKCTARVIETFVKM